MNATDKKRIAIPVFQNRVSPVLDWSTRILIFEPMEDRKMRQKLRNAHPLALVDHLEELLIHVLICGGISAHLFTLVKNRGIRVIPWVAGDVDEVITAFLDGRLPGEGFSMPGCCKRQRRDRWCK